MKVQTEFSKRNKRKKSKYTTIMLHCYWVNYPITFPRVTGLTGWQTVTGVTGMTVSDRIFQINSDQPCHSSHYYLPQGHLEIFRFVFTQNTSIILYINKFYLIIIKTVKFVKKVGYAIMKLWSHLGARNVSVVMGPGVTGQPLQKSLSLSFWVQKMTMSRHVYSLSVYPI